MRRRRLLGIAIALLVPFGAKGQASKRRTYKVIGLSNSTPEAAGAYIKALEDGFRELGYAVGDNVVIDYLWSAGRPERLPGLAAEAVRRKPDVIITVSNAETAAASAATKVIPIVMGLGAGPAEAGLIASLARPGGNVTGITTDASPEILGKQLQLLREVNPALKRVGLLWDPTVPGFDQFVGRLRDAADKLSLALRSVEIRRGDQLDGALAKVGAERVEALCVIANVLTFTYRARIAEFTAKHKLPAISYMSEFVEAGFLLSYGADLVQLYKRSATYADKIFRGARPADMPVEQPTKFEMVVNLKTAKTLGLTIPQSLLLRADRVIE